MKPDRLPVLINVRKLAQKNARLQGEVDFTSFPRLKEYPMLAGMPETGIKVKLSFEYDEEGRVLIQGTLETVLPLICQRCLERFDCFIEVGVRIAPVFSLAQVKCLPDSYDPLMIESEEVTLVELIEDDLLLGLPLIPKHAENEECVVFDHVAIEKQDNPFEALKALQK